ncbi:MAG: 5'/3'-nucleotidase SurE [Bacillota bacterium]
MRILLANDDGIHADGLAALRRELLLAGHTLTVVAPDRERSATGHAITIHHPLRVEAVEFSEPAGVGLSVSGTPADCVKLAIKSLMEIPPDLVVSGINRGPNLGTDLFYSGTVSAAIEGVILGFPAIAVSLCAFENTDFAFAARFARQAAEALMAADFPRNTLLNINVPALPEEEVAGWAVTRLGTRNYQNRFQQRVDPRGRTYYWLAGELLDEEDLPDTDVQAIRDNLVSVTPVHLDLTKHDLLEKVAGLKLNWRERGDV